MRVTTLPFDWLCVECASCPRPVYATAEHVTSHFRALLLGAHVECIGCRVWAGVHAWLCVLGSDSGCTAGVQVRDCSTWMYHPPSLEVVIPVAGNSPLLYVFCSSYRCFMCSACLLWVVFALLNDERVQMTTVAVVVLALSLLLVGCLMVLEPGSLPSEYSSSSVAHGGICYCGLHSYVGVFRICFM